MVRFEFRLKTLLSLRHADQSARRAELAAACARESQLAECVQAIEAQLEQHRDWVRAGTAPGAIATAELRNARWYEARLRTQLAEAVSSRATAADELGRCQQAAAAAESEVRALEKLCQRQLEEHWRQQARIETRRLDEVGARPRPTLISVGRS